MCFGGKGGGGHQGGGSSQEDAEVRNSHTEAGISAAETRRYFREKENPAHSRNENAPGGTTSVSHSRDEGGNLVAKQVEYGQGSFAPPQGEREGRMKAENILGKRNDVNQIGNDLDIGGTIFKNARLSKSGNSIISTDPNNVGTMGGITSGGGLWGGNKIKSVLGVTDGVGAVNSRGIATSLITPVLDEQRRSRTAKYQAQSDLFKNSTPAEIEAIRAANRKKSPADRDGDGSWLTSTDDMGRIAGIGSRGDGSGAQPYIFDPTLGKEYQALPQLDPNRGADTNLTTFGKAMRTVKPVLGALGFSLPILAEKLDQKGFIPDVLKGNTGRGTDIEALEDLKTTPSGEITRGDNFTYAPTRFATSNQNEPSPFARNLNLGSLGGIEAETNNIGASSATALSSMGGAETDLAIGTLPNRPQLRPKIMANNLDDANKYGETITVDGYPKKYAQTVPVSTYFRMNDPFGDYNDDNFDQVMPPSDEPETSSSSPYFNYTEWTPSDPTYLGTSSYGGKWSTGASGVASTAPTGIYSDGGASAQVLTDFYNDKTGQYYTAPNAGFYAEAGSNWKRGRPTSSYA